ncbi:MAG: hypothetical protein QXP71_03465 [Desulfurococcaceae archaeon]
MKIIDRIDLTRNPESCSQHPLIRLKNIIEKLNFNEAVEVLTDNEIIPVKALEIIASKHNIELKIVESNKQIYKIILFKNS